MRMWTPSPTVRASTSRSRLVLLVSAKNRLPPAGANDHGIDLQVQCVGEVVLDQCLRGSWCPCQAGAPARPRRTETRRNNLPGTREPTAFVANKWRATTPSSYVRTAATALT